MALEKKQGIIGTVLVVVGALAGAVGNETISEPDIQFLQDQENNTFVCDVTEEFGVFYGGISGTSYTAYPFSETRTGRVYCKNDVGDKGQWIPLYEYLEAQNLSIDAYFEEKEEELILKSADNGLGGDSVLKCPPEQKGCYRVR